MPSTIVLTELERQTLLCVERGWTNQQLCQTPGYFCSISTLGKRLNELNHKLGTTTKHDAAGRARELGLLDAPVQQS